MGISTFLHVVSDEEQRVLALCSDSTIKTFISRMCERPFVESDEENVIDAMQVLQQLVEEAQQEEAAAQAIPADAPVLTRTRYRADLDKAGALVAYLTSNASGTFLEDEHEGLRSILQQRPLGDDVCYGPAALVSAASVRELSRKLAQANVTEASIDALFDDLDHFPSVLGGLCGISERDREYGVLNWKSFKALLDHAVAEECGLLIHFW